VANILLTAEAIASAADPYDAPPVDRAADLLAAALAFAARGWHVLPLHHPIDAGCSCGGFRCKVGKHPRTQHGVTDASRDEAAIRAWWATWPLANIGIATGIASGLVVLDVDARNGGTESFARLVQERGEIGRTRLVFTSGGGFHVYLAHPRDRGISCRVGLPGYPGLDVKGDGGYAIAPPSLHVSGVLYRTRPGEEAAPIAPAPAWLLDLAAADVRGARVAVAWTGAAMLSERARLVIDTNPRARARFDRNAEALLDASPSGVDLALASTISGLGIDDDSDLAAAIIESRARAKLPPPSATYLRATIGRAKTNAPRDDRDEPGRPDPTAALAFDTDGGDAQETRPTLSRLTNADEPLPGGFPMPDALDLAPDAPAKPPPLTDLGNAERFVAQHGAGLRYCPELRAWLRWDGMRWERTDAHALDPMARETVRTLLREAFAEDDPERRAALTRHAAKSESEGRIRAVVGLATCVPGVLVARKALDVDPAILNVANGTLHLDTGELRPHRRSDLLTRLAPVAFDPEARSEEWERVLAHALPDDALRAYFARVAGYSLGGEVRHDAVFFFHGPTGSAKSTIIGAIEAMLGSYVESVEFSTFLRHRDVGGTQPGLAKLPGARVAVCNEVEPGRAFNVGLLKAFSAGDTVTCHAKYEAPFTFRPLARLWLVANDRPEAPHTDGAVWRRLRVIPFEQPVEKPDEGLKGRLRDPSQHGAAILAWAMRGRAEWIASGRSLDPPESVVAAGREYRASQNPLGDFVETLCTLSPNAWASTPTLRAAVERFSGTKLADRALADALKALGCEAKMRHGVRGWLGIELRIEGGER